MTTKRNLWKTSALPTDISLQSTQLGSQVANNDIDVVIFLRDPVTANTYEPNINSILRLCDLHNIPLASNLATAEILLLALDRGDLDWRNVVK